MALAPLSLGFWSPLSLPTSILGPSGAGSQLGGLVYVRRSCGSLQQLSCEGGSLSRDLNPHMSFQFRFLVYFSALGPWVAWSVSLSHLVYQHMNVGPWSASCLVHLTGSAGGHSMPRVCQLPPVRPGPPATAFPCPDPSPLATDSAPLPV